MKTVILETRDGWRKTVAIPGGDGYPLYFRMPFEAITDIDRHAEARSHYDPMAMTTFTYKDFEWWGDVEQEGDFGIEVWRER